MPDREGERVYRLYREQIESQAAWTATLTTWLLAANALLATAIAVRSTAEFRDPSAAMMRRGLPTVGLVTNAGVVAPVGLTVLLLGWCWWLVPAAR